MVAEVVHGAPYRFRDPARFSLAHGGKDRHPYPVPIKVYDETIRVMKLAVRNAKLGPTKQRLYHDDVSFGLDHLVYFDTEIRHGSQQAAPDLFKATPDRHEAFLAIRKVSSLCAVSAKSQHAVDIMSVIGGEKLSGDRLHIVVSIHSHFP